MTTATWVIAIGTLLLVAVGAVGVWLQFRKGDGRGPIMTVNDDGYLAVDDGSTDRPAMGGGRGAELTVRIGYASVDYDVATGRHTSKASSIVVANEASETVAREVRVSLDGKPIMDHPDVYQGPEAGFLLSGPGEVHFRLARDLVSPESYQFCVRWRDQLGRQKWETILTP